MANLSTNYNVAQIKNDLQAVLHGTTLNQVQNLNNIFFRAAQQVLLDVDPQETKVTVQTPQLFDQVFNYSITQLPDLKGNKIIDIRPQVNRTPLDQFSQTFAKEFDVYKQYRASSDFTVDFNAANKSLRIDATRLQSGIVLNNADGLANNGTFTAGGSASGLAQDTINYVSPSGSSLMFNLANGGSQGTVSTLNQQAIDLTTHQNQSYLFWYVYLPSASAFTSVALQFGSSFSNYWTVTATTAWNQTSFINGWNLIGVPWSQATQTGTPVVSSITYLNAIYNYNGTPQTAVHLDYVSSRMGQIFEIMYYSKFLFRDATTGILQEIVTDDSNLINLDTETFPLFFDKLAEFTCAQVRDQDMSQDIQYWHQKYHGIANNPNEVGDLMRYKAMYKSEVEKPNSTYYRKPQQGWSKFLGGRFFR